MNNLKIRLITLFLFIASYYSQSLTLLAQEKYKPIFGHYYRNNTFTPLLINYNENFNAIWAENKFTKVQLIFNQNKEAEILAKIQTDGTRFELIDNRDEKLILNTSFQSIPEEIPLVAILKNNLTTLPITSEAVRMIEIDTLPENEVAIKMLDVLIITEDFQSQLSAKQTEAVKNWVLTGGTIIFESVNCIKIQSGIAVPLLKQIIKQDLPQIKEEMLINNLQQLVTSLQQKPTVISIGNGALGIKSLIELNTFAKIESFCNGSIKWNIRNRNTALTQDNSLKKDISRQQTNLLQKVVLIYFLIIIIFLLLKPKQYFVRFTCILAGISIVPIIIITPTNYLNAHYYQLNLKKTNNQFSYNKEHIYLQKGDIKEITITFNDGLPYFVNEESKIYLYKNINGQYEKQTISSTKDYLTLSKTNISNKSFIEKITKENTDYVFHRNSLSKVYMITEDKVRTLKFKEISNDAKGIITQFGEINSEDSRDHFESSIWYLFSNQVFYTPESKIKSLLAIEGENETIPLQIEPALKIKQSYLSYLITN